MSNRPQQRALIIVDSPGKEGLYEGTLGLEGFVMRFLDDAEDFVGISKQWRPSVVLVDSSKVSSLLDDLAKLKLFMPIPVLIVLDSADSEVLSESDAGRFDDFLVRHFEPEELTARVYTQLKLSGAVNETRADNIRLENLLSITRELFSTLDYSAILSVIVKKVAEAIDAMDCSLVLVKKDFEQGFVLDSFQELPTKNLKLDLKKYPELMKVLATKEPLSIKDIASHPIMADVRDSIRELVDMNALVIPVVFDDPVMGTVFLRAKRTGTTFSDDDFFLCQLVADASYHAMKNACLHETVSHENDRLMEISVTDQLTGLYNHNFFYSRLEEEFSRAARYGMPLSVIMLDIDDFKKINDTYGHQVGDKVLQRVSSLLKTLMRKVDIVARYGGEEFAVILGHTPLTGAMKEAERLRKMVEAHDFHELKTEKLTLSLGVAAYRRDEVKDSVELVGLADKALYRAKEAGKNCVMAEEA